jgi:hypothetical protein
MKERIEDRENEVGERNRKSSASKKRIKEGSEEMEITIRRSEKEKEMYG